MSKVPVRRTGKNEVGEFLREAQARRNTAGDSRLVFALDATASREASWDRACALHAEMFDVAASLGGIAVQLVYYRGFREFHASNWSSSSKELLKLMTAVRCAAGATQVERVLAHALQENGRKKIGAVVLIGDAFEDSLDRCCELAGQLGLRKVPVFAFQEGHDTDAERGFKEIAKLSSGEWCRLDASSAGQLRELLRAVATYVAGGRSALKRLGLRNADARRLVKKL